MAKLWRRMPCAVPPAARRTAEPEPKTVRWRMADAAGEPKPAARSTPDDAGGWLTSSMDLVKGVDVVEADHPPVDGGGG